jgi:hypothetical protein
MIRHFLEVSSGHLSPDTWTWLDTLLAGEALRDPRNEHAMLIAGGRTRHGWIVYAPDESHDGVPNDLVAVLKYARARGADYVLLDCDATPDLDLPVLHPDFADSA